MFWTVAWAAFDLWGVYEFAVGITPTDPANLITFGIGVVITVLFFIYSKIFYHAKRSLT